MLVVQEILFARNPRRFWKMTRIHIVSYLIELFRMIYTGGNELWNFCNTSKK
jgi:hypothetical protein